MEVVVNGSRREVPDASSVADLIEAMGLGSRWVVVERNGEPVVRSEHATTRLAAGDRLELVRAVAGG